MAAEYAKDNKAHLESTVGGRIGASELYLAHFLGPAGAAKFLNAMKQNETQPAAALFHPAPQAHPPVFYEGTQPLTLSVVFDRLAAIVRSERHTSVPQPLIRTS